MYQLYYSPGACSLAIHALLLELGQKVELINTSLTEGKNRDAAFLKLNPRGQVPVLVDDGFAIREGGAIITYLLDKHQSPMLPKSGKERALALEWLMFANSTLHPAYSRVFFINRQCQDEAAKQQLLAVAVAAIDKLWAEIEERLSAQPYLCGKDCSAADILVAVIANWQAWVPLPITIGKKTKHMLESVAKRSAFQKALAAEGVEYKAAA